MKYWDKVLLQDLDYDRAVKESHILDGNAQSCITRPNWNGVHFMLKDDYYILLEDGLVLKNPEEVYGLDKDDWMIVTITPEASKIIRMTIGM